MEYPGLKELGLDRPARVELYFTDMRSITGVVQAELKTWILPANRVGIRFDPTQCPAGTQKAIIHLVWDIQAILGAPVQTVVAEDQQRALTTVQRMKAIVQKRKLDDRLRNLATMARA